MKEGTTGKHGFTIVELLTVMSVIAVLIGLLVPALNLVKDYSRQIQQQAQFHSIEAALEMFNADFGAYPESNDNLDMRVPANDNMNDVGPYCGANKLAEAMVGLDYLGFHPNSDFRSTGVGIIGVNNTGPIEDRVYRADQGNAWQTTEENIKSRKGPYIEFENANAFRMDDVYTTNNLTTAGFTPNFTTDVDSYYPLVLCDVFAKKRSNAASGNSRKTGMPILYFRARTQFVDQDYDSADVSATRQGDILDDIYYYPDNQHILMAGSPEDQTIVHPLIENGGGPADFAKFEDMILNKQVQGIQRPYRAGSYILMSAGKDGLYGTGDDLFNFNREVQ